jgi:hypothetical protein
MPVQGHSSGSKIFTWYLLESSQHFPGVCLHKFRPFQLKPLLGSYGSATLNFSPQRVTGQARVLAYALQ